MTNSDYLIKATIKKLSERLNKTFIEKIEEANEAAQGVPEILKKEIEFLKDEIIKEAKVMEEENSNNDNYESKNNSEFPIINEVSSKIKEIDYHLKALNDILDN